MLLSRLHEWETLNMQGGRSKVKVVRQPTIRTPDLEYLQQVNAVNLLTQMLHYNGRIPLGSHSAKYGRRMLSSAGVTRTPTQPNGTYSAKGFRDLRRPHSRLL